MITSFVLLHVPDIYFGEGSFGSLAKVIKEHAKSILLITGKHFAVTEQWNNLQDEIKVLNVKCFHHIVSGEPSPGIIDQIVEEYRGRVDMVAGIGGGSVVDAGKAVSAMLKKEESVKVYLEGIGTGKKHDGDKVPYIAVPTTAGTGSEVTKNAVLSEVGEKGFKKSLRHDFFVPNVAIIDPVLMLSCPPSVTAACAMDALSQLIESYISVKATHVTDFIAWEGVKAIKQGIVPVADNPRDIEARKHMAYAALSSGVTLANAGLGVIHGLAGPIGGFFHIPHGVVCGTLLAEACKSMIYKIQQNEGDEPVVLNKFINLGQLLSGKIGKNSNYYLSAFVDVIEQWTMKLKIPLLGQYGVKHKDIDKIIMHCSQKNNPVQLDKNDLTKILQARI